MDSRFFVIWEGKILRSRSVFTTPFGKPEGRVRHDDEKRKIPPEVKRPQTGRECNNKGTDCSALDVTVLFQVVHENAPACSVLTVTPCSSLYRPEKFTMYSPSVHPLSNQLPSRRTRTNSEGPEAAILPPSAKIPDLVFFHYRYFQMS